MDELISDINNTRKLDPRVRDLLLKIVDFIACSGGTQGPEGPPGPKGDTGEQGPRGLDAIPLEETEPEPEAPVEQA